MSDELKMPLPGSLQEIVGALLFASEVPLTAADIRQAVKAVECEQGENAEVMEVYRTCTSKEIESALRGLEKALEVAQSGFKLVCTGGAYRLQTIPSCGRYVRAMLKIDRPSRLGRASLETLAIIAYRQPIAKSEIEAIRGVDVSANIKTLMDLQLIRLVGKSELPGHPFLYGTTPLFLEHFGLANLQQLNELDPTLQRSNPRAKAAQYKKVEKTELEKAASEELEEKAAQEQLENQENEQAQEETAQEEVESPIEEQEDLLSHLEAPAVGAAVGDDDEDFEIDDTPDEFDDDDDDEDEEDDEEMEEEDDED
ncbi:MAG: SMC-Scp complex subunit ScpB [Kiritimatiellae bacterium]|nr:SMC-Scp complex subunit ScpB [Kiritimatiellia bacterium]